MPSEHLRPLLPRGGNLTRERGDPSSRRALVGNGDVTDLREWGSHYPAWTDRSRRIKIAEHVGRYPRQPAEQEYASMRNAAQEASAFQSWNRAAYTFLALLGEAPIAAGAAP